MNEKIGYLMCKSEVPPIASTAQPLSQIIQNYFTAQDGYLAIHTDTATHEFDFDTWGCMHTINGKPHTALFDVARVVEVVESLAAP